MKFGGKSTIAFSICFLKCLKTAKKRRSSTRVEFAVCHCGGAPGRAVCVTHRK
jgi:hypothetical protein